MWARSSSNGAGSRNIPLNKTRAFEISATPPNHRSAYCTAPIYFRPLTIIAKSYPY